MLLQQHFLLSQNEMRWPQVHTIRRIKQVKSVKKLKLHLINKFFFVQLTYYFPPIIEFIQTIASSKTVKFNS